MFTHTWNRKKLAICRFGLAIIAAMAAGMMLATVYRSALAAEATQRGFKSPEEAVQALTDAVKGNNEKELLRSLVLRGRN